ncbi:glutaredoxin family protein [Lamprocystis purpurea]|uniref:glutaredoxin family protein n=1 Tax=Lamprocystis purpurea TaxID=61598 RepID=UPI0003672E2C|nr:thioredoxin family protein [Lamprocystis purpurea]
MLHFRLTGRVLLFLSLALGVLLGSALRANAETASSDAIEWLATDAAGQPRVPIYVFWSRQCPHCREALPFLAQLRDQEPWIEVRDFEINKSRENTQRYVEMAQALGEDARSVPAFFVCGQMLTGYDNAQGMGARILGLARFCRQATGAEAAAGEGAAAVAGDAPAPTIEVPFIGTLDAGSLSLPLFTLVIAGLDAFNPCAFFVLLFLLSLLVHARSRARMLLIGGTFVLFSGLVYFLFMAAWLNLFLVVGGAPVVTTIAGAVALVIGGLNVKDYFWFKQGPSLSIPEGAKPGLFKRMRTLVTADRLGTMLIGTVVLALAANSYELLCTAGFPMVFTRVLTLNDLTPAAHYGYLVFYNLIYILPLLTIVLVFTYTLGTRKLTEQQGRILKLLSGFMMLGLGLVMLIAPELLSRPWVGALLLGTALILAATIALLERRMRSAAS